MFAGKNEIWVSADRRSKLVWDAGGDSGSGVLTLTVDGTVFFSGNATKLGFYGATPGAKPATATAVATAAITAVATTALTSGTNIGFGFTTTAQANVLIASVNSLVTRVDAAVTAINTLKANQDTLGLSA